MGRWRPQELSSCHGLGDNEGSKLVPRQPSILPFDPLSIAAVLLCLYMSIYVCIFRQFVIPKWCAVIVICVEDKDLPKIMIDTMAGYYPATPGLGYRQEVNWLSQCTGISSRITKHFLFISSEQYSKFEVCTRIFLIDCQLGMSGTFLCSYLT